MARENDRAKRPTHVVFDLIRYAVFSAFVFSGAVAVGSWAVRTRRINPFGRPGQLVRKVSDPVLQPLETFLLGRGGNPQHAGWWLLGISIGGGILILTAMDWVAMTARRAVRAAEQGVSGLIGLVVYYGSGLLLIALIVRVVGSWFGLGPFHRWMRPFYVLTDWIVRPLQRIVPPLGTIDITPIIAWILILLLRETILGLLSR